ncbi:hypothetical protein [Nonomuraea dietziae]|uniref:hypothetical protein n=1 Tax=Nonomuraea dietziae TaxID=65515 RepID=UPI0031DF6F85
MPHGAETFTTVTPAIAHSAATHAAAMTASPVPRGAVALTSAASVSASTAVSVARPRLSDPQFQVRKEISGKSNTPKKSRVSRSPACRLTIAIVTRVRAAAASTALSATARRARVSTVSPTARSTGVRQARYLP